MGRRVSFDNGRTWMTIVGMVNDTHDYGLDEKPTDEIYRAFAQTAPLNATLLVRDRRRSRRSRAASRTSCTRSTPGSRSAASGRSKRCAATRWRRRA